MATIGSLVVSLIAETAQFEAGLRKSRSEAQSFVSMMNGAKFSIGGASGVAELTESFHSLTEQAASFAGRGGALDALNVGMAETARVAERAATQTQGLIGVLGTLKNVVTGPVGIASLFGGAAAFSVEMGSQALIKRFRENERRNAQPLDSYINRENEAEVQRLRAQEAEDAARAKRAQGAAGIDALIIGGRESILEQGMTAGQKFFRQVDKLLADKFKAGELTAQEAIARLKIASDIAKEMDTITKLDDAAREAAASEAETERRIDAVKRFNRTVMRSVMTPLERLQDTLQQIADEEEFMGLDKTTVGRLTKEAQDRFAASQPRPRSEPPAALLFGTNAAFAREANPRDDKLDRIAKGIERQVQLAEGAAKNNPFDRMQPVDVFRIGAGSAHTP